MRLQQIAQGRFRKILFLTSLPPVGLIFLIIAGVVWPEARLPIAVVTVSLGLAFTVWVRYELITLIRNYSEALGTAEEHAEALEEIDRELRGSRDQLAAAIQLRDEFLSIASHELRTPLTSLYLQLQMIQRALKRQELGQIGREVASKIHFTLHQARQLARLIDSVLDISQLSSGPFSLRCELVEVGAVVAGVVERMETEALAAGSRLSLATEEGVEGYCDRTRLDQAINHLVGNAIKYGAGKPIEVSVSRNTREGSAVIRVKDQGIGIEPKDWERIFNRFERAISHKNISGLGLGLYITRQIAEAHGGTIRVQSELGNGSEFILEIQLKEAQPEESASSSNRVHGLLRKSEDRSETMRA